MLPPGKQVLGAHSSALSRPGDQEPPLVPWGAPWPSRNSWTRWAAWAGSRVSRQWPWWSPSCGSALTASWTTSRAPCPATAAGRPSWTTAPPRPVPPRPWALRPSWLCPSHRAPTTGPTSVAASASLSGSSWTPTPRPPTGARQPQSPAWTAGSTTAAPSAPPSWLR